MLLLMALFRPRASRGGDLLISLAIYGGAKALEEADKLIFRIWGIVSGHTLKHIAAAISAFWILRMLQRRAPIPIKASPIANDTSSSTPWPAC
jgi:hypothetical protein